jgi:hypothetical protein
VLICSCSKDKNNVSQVYKNNNLEIIEEEKIEEVRNEFYESFPPVPKINAKLSDFYIGKDISEYNIKSRHMMIIDTNYMNEFFFIVDDGIVYGIVYSKDNIVKHIVVEDLYLKKFETPEGVSIGMTYHELKEIVPNIKIHEISGFGYFGQLESKWKVGFYSGKTATEYFPKNTDKIKSIFLGGHNLSEWGTSRK